VVMGAFFPRSAPKSNGIKAVLYNPRIFNTASINN
jgi:hypothetical protein